MKFLKSKLRNRLTTHVKLVVGMYVQNTLHIGKNTIQWGNQGLEGLEGSKRCGHVRVEINIDQLQQPFAFESLS